MPGAWGEFLRLRGALHASADRSVGGVPRHRAERERLRAHRRRLSGGAEPSGAGSARRAAPARGRRLSTSCASSSDVRIARRGSRSRRNEDGRVAVAVDRSDRSALGHRCGRCGRATPGRRGCLSRNCSVTKRPRPFATRSTPIAQSCSSRRRKATCDSWRGQAVMRSAPGARHARRRPVARHGWVVSEPTGREPMGRFRRCSLAAADRRPAAAAAADDRRHCRAGIRLCARAAAAVAPAEVAHEQSLEPLLPGFLCASPAMMRVVEQIQRLQGNELTVLITGESGTGKELVARAIHVGSLRSAAVFLPYNCTTTTRELADSQLFGHRRAASPARSTISWVSFERPQAARCSSTKSATCRSTCSRSCCASSSRAKSCRSAKHARKASTCA